MKSKNTVEIGDRFEAKVFKLFSDELFAGRLFFSPKACKIFRKKGYYSKDRGRDIVVDISIETYLPNQDHWSILTVVECKDYTSSVPVSDVEEFYAKLGQIGGAKVKGVIVASMGFQEGALNYAKSKGIAAVRILDGTGFKWILTRTTTGFISPGEFEENQTNIYRGLVDENYTSDNIDFYANISNVFTHSAWRMVECLTREYIEQGTIEGIISGKFNEQVHVPFIQIDEIEGQVTEILNAVSYKQSEFDIEAYCEYLKNNSDLTIEFVNDLGRDHLGFEILGKITFDPVNIQISRGGHSNIFSRKFTLAHEIGHYYMNHGQYLLSEHYSDEELERSDYLSVVISDIRRMEWQANHFASCLLLPRRSIIAEFQKLLSMEDVKDRGHGVLFVDDQQCNLNTYYKVTNDFRDSFRVSRKVIEIRLKDLNLINDARKPRRLDIENTNVANSNKI